MLIARLLVALVIILPAVVFTAAAFGQLAGAL